MKKLTVIIFILACVCTNAFSQNSLGKSATEITVEVEINLPIEKVWASISKIEDFYLSSPTVSNSTIISDIKYGIGAVRHLEMSKMIKEGAILDEKVTEWEEGTFQKLEVINIVKVAGIQTMGGDFRLKRSGNNTILTSSLHYSMKNNMWGMMNNMMGVRKFTKTWASIVAGIKKHAETNEDVTENTKLDLSQVKILSIKKHLER
jgi:hypothetical protein